MQRQSKNAKTPRVKASQTSLDVFSLLKTNHVTTPHERPFIEASIEEYRRALESTEEEIRRLSDKRATYESIIEAHHNLLRPSPIRTMPPEILSDIFAAYCDMHQLPDPSPPSSAREQATFFQSRMHLLRICRRWREVAFSTPRIWSTFLITRKGVELSQRWLASAGMLTVDLSCAMGHDEAAHKLLCTYLPRCKKLDLFVPSARCLNNLVSPASRVTTLTLRLSMDLAYNTAMPLWPKSLLQNLPAVTSLTTNAPPEVLSPFAAQLSQLILLRPVSLWDVLPYLRVLKRLKSFHFALRKHYTRDDIVLREQEPITHEHLESLQFESANPFIDDHHEILLTHLILPRLRHLDIKPFLFYPEQLKKLFERSSCQISSLALDIHWPHPRPRHDNSVFFEGAIKDRLGECLKSPQVEKHLKKFSLIMRDFNESREKIPDALLQLLSGTTDHFPKLTELHFQSCSKQVPQILDLLRNRATDYQENGVAQLKLLEIEYGYIDCGEPRLSDRDIATFRKNGTVVETRICGGED